MNGIKFILFGIPGILFGLCCLLLALSGDSQFFSGLGLLCPVAGGLFCCYGLSRKE